MSRSQTRTRATHSASNGSLTLDHLDLSVSDIVHDYRVGYRSREASLVGRREVMSGKAKFGIFGDGKEVPQLAMARAFRPGDWRSGYYRDQTFILAVGDTTLQAFFAQLYAHADVEAEPATAGRAMNAHFATRLLNPDGSWRDQTKSFNSSSDVSPTGTQMPRLVGLGYASRIYRELAALHGLTQFSHRGSEVAFGTIGNASCAEGMFWEAVNAIGILRAPVVLSIWDDGYGISVSNEFQVLKQDLSQLLQGFQRAKGSCEGYDIYTVRGWDYPALVEAYRKATDMARYEFVPAILHVTELTQPQGHSTSGSHERYKSPERLAWEAEYDCLAQMRTWMIEAGIAKAAELDQLEAEERRNVEDCREEAWQAFLAPMKAELDEAVMLIDGLAEPSVADVRTRLAGLASPLRRDIAVGVHQVLRLTRGTGGPARAALADWWTAFDAANHRRYDSHLYSESSESALAVPEVKPVYGGASPEVLGFEVVNACFDAALARDPRLIAFGEDLGKIGDVNQGFRGLQDKYGPVRVEDTGIREATILGQAIGMAMRGLRPICEIQYLDYALYALQVMSDDLATLQWRTAGGQKAPVIVRTRGHRLEGIWHSGSLMAGLIHLLRGMHVLVPRDMTRAAGFYNTLLRSDEPALVVEVLNGYRVRERLPDNIDSLTVPLGVPELLREGTDVTVVTYGACCRIVLEAAAQLDAMGISSEVIDVQSLLPFDIHGRIGESLRKTGRIVFVDEDVPGGTSAYMLQEVMERQEGYYWLDSPARTLPGKPHRPAYGSDGDYWSKPSAEDVFDAVYELMGEVDPGRWPALA